MALTFAERMAALKKPLPTPTVEIAKDAPATQANTAITPPISVHASNPTTDTPIAAPAVKRFGVKAPIVETPTVVEKAPEPKQEIEIGNIILLANEAHSIIPNSDKDKTEGEFLVEGELPIDAIRIKQKIAEMETFDGISLRHEMDQLKKLIKASPDACMFLLPEELGLCVRALRRMTDNKVAMDMGSTKARATKKQPELKLSAEDIAAALDDL